jgi:hypothetical protein
VVRLSRKMGCSNTIKKPFHFSTREMKRSAKTILAVIKAEYHQNQIGYPLLYLVEFACNE